MAAEETFQPFYNITVPETGKSYRISQQAYEQGADSLFRNYPNAQVTRVSLSGADDDDINERDQFQVKMDDGSFQTVSAQKYGAKKDQMFRDFPDAEVYKVSDMSYQRYKPLMDEQRQALEDFRSGNSDFMREYEERLGRLQSVRGDVRGNEQFEAESAFVHDNAESYRGFKQRGEELAREYYNNPLVIRERREGAEMSKTLSEQFRESGKNAETWAEKRDWARAAKLMEDVQKLYEAPGEFDKDKDRNNILHALQSYWKGTKDKFGDTDIYFFGIAEILRNLSVYGINKRIEEAEEKKGGDLSEQEIDRLVTPAEKALLQSVSQLAKAQSDRDDINGAYLAGQGFMESIPFMADFIISGGYGSATGKLIGKGAQNITKEGTRKALVSWLGRSLMTERDILKAERAGMKLSNLSEVVGATGKKAARYINWADEAVAEPLIKGLWHTAAPMSPTGLRGWTNITENLLQTDDQGNMMSFGRAWWKGTLDTIIENWSESVGGALEKGMALPFKGLGWVGEKTIGKGSLGRWARWLYEATPTQLFKEAGFNGMIGEMAEEWVGNMARVGVGLMTTDEFADFASWKQQLEMAASFAPLSLFGLVTGALGARKKAHRWKQLSEDVKGILRKQGVSEEEINNIFNTKYDTAEDIAKKFVPYVGAIQKQAQSGDGKQAKKDYQKMLDFAWATGERMIFDEWHNIEKSYNRQQAGLEIADRLGRDFTTTDKDGNKRVTRIERPDGMTGYAVAESDEDGLRAVVWDDGSTGFTRVSPDGVDEDGNAISKILPSQSEDEYLDGYIAEKKRVEEAARIEQEEKQNSMNLAEQLAAGVKIPMGTVENPVEGTIIEVNPDDRVVIVKTPDGARPIPFKEAASRLGLPLKAKTDAELEEEQLATEVRLDKKKQTLNDSLAGGSKIPVVDGFEAVRFLPAQTDQDGNTRFPVMLRAVDTQDNSILPGRNVETGEDGQTGVVYLTENEMDRLIAAMPLGERAARYNGIQQGTELDVSYPSGEEGEVITEKIRFTRAVVEDGQLMLYGINEKGDEVSVTEDMVTNLPGVVETEAQEPVKADGNLENEDNSQMDDKDPLADYRYQSEATGQVEVDSDRLWDDNPKEWCRWNDTENTDPDKVTSREKLQWALGELDKKIKKLTDAIREGNLKGMDRTKKDNLRKDRNALSGRHDELQSLMELYPEKKAESHTVEASEDAAGYGGSRESGQEGHSDVQQPLHASVSDTSAGGTGEAGEVAGSDEDLPFDESGNYVGDAAGEVETGPFGRIFRQFAGKAKEAVRALVENRGGEAIGALNHPEIGAIDLVWGEEGTGKIDGFGLSKLLKYYPEVVENLQEILDDMSVVSRTENRVQLESERNKATVRLTWDEQRKTWLLTAFEKKNSALDNTTDTGETSNGSERNDTATPQDTVSSDKDSENSSKASESEENPQALAAALVRQINEIEEQINEKIRNRENYLGRRQLYDQKRRLETQLEQLLGGLNAKALADLEASEDESIRSSISEFKKKDAARRLRSRISALVAKAQQFVRTKAKAIGSKLNLGDYLAPKGDARVLMTGVFHDGGYAVASDTQILIADKASYEEKNEGKVIGRDGKPIEGKYPKWRELLPDFEAINKQWMDFGKLRDFIASARAAIEKEYEQRKASGDTKASKAKYLKNTFAKVILNLGKNEAIAFKLDHLSNFADFAERIGAKELYYSDEKRAIFVKTGKGIGMLMPVQLDWTRGEAAERAEFFSDNYVYSYGENEYQKQGAAPESSEENVQLTDAQKNVLGWLDGKSPEQVEREYEEKRKAEEKALEESEKMRKKVEDRIAKWKKLLGDVFEVHTDISTVTDKQAIREIEEDGSQVNGWYDPATGKAHLYIPHILKDENPLSRVDKTILHECLAHKGVRGIFKTEEQLNDFFDKVWKMMENYTWGGVPAREHFIGYVGGTGTFATEQEAQRAAADEFVAHCAEADEAVIKEMDSNFWTRLLDFIKDIFKASAGMDIFEEEGANPFADIIRQSLADFVKARRESEAKQREEQALQETKEDVLAAIDGEETKATSTRKAQDNPQIAVSQTQEKYEDFGEKIGMARKDTAVSGIKRGDADARPSWAKKYNTVNVRMLSDEEMAQRQRYLGYHSKNFDEVISDISKGTDFNQPFVGFWDEEKKTAFGTRTIRHYITGEGGKPIIFLSQAQFEATMPVFEASRSGFRVIAYKDGKFRIAKQASNGKYVEYAEFDSREDAVAYLSSPEGATDLLNRKRENYELPALEELTRNGMPDYRNGRDVTPDDFQSAFGFRGGEFGNWLNAEERKQFLNYAYDALMDLATILHISPRALSLGGELSIAFGARGKQGAKAHYEPTRAVINLTKMNGAGSLAHEWAHALDNYFGMMDARQERIRDEKQGDKNDHYLSRERSYQKGAREEVRNAFKEVMDVLTHKMEERAIVEEKEQEQLDKRRNWLRREVDFARKRLEMGRTTYDYNRKTKKREEVKHTMTEEQLSTFDKLASELESDPTFKYDWDFSRDQHRGMGETADKLRELVKEIMPDRKSDNPLDNIFHHTDLLRKQAERLQAAKDGKTETLRVETTVLESSKWFDRGRASAYYSKPIEMFARAFETYVAGEMKAGVQSSDYLTYEKSPLYMAAWGKSPYPMGEERVAAKAAFDKLFQTIREKTDEQTGKQVLYSRVGALPMNPRSLMPNVRGGWTKAKIRKWLGHEYVHALTGVRTASKAIAEFDNIEQLKEHMFYHGTVFAPAGLKPSITMSEREAERYGGGGYGQRYWGISLSKDKKIASNFSGTSRGVRIYPVILLKDAKVIEGTQYSDAIDVEDDIEKLWNEGVDAVWIGDKNKGEQELLVLNPRAIVNIGTSDYYSVYQLGTEQNPIRISDDKAIAKMYETAKELASTIAPKAPSKPSRYHVDEEGHYTERKSDEEYNAEMEHYEEEMKKFLQTPEKQAYDDLMRRADSDVRFSRIAPNGRPSHLSDEQWEMVRTPQFKKWFGDWEKATRVEKLRSSDNAEIEGNEIAPPEILDKKAALAYGKRLQGSYVNADTGDTIQLQRGRRNGGINEVLQHNYKDVEHLQSVAAIPQIIEKSIYIDSEPNNKREKNPDVAEFQHFLCGLRIGKTDYTVHSFVAVDKNGNRYYDHNLTTIEKTKLLDLVESQAVNGEDFGTTPGTKPTILAGYKGKQLISLLQNNSSKVVDENGEPLVVEHATNNDFTEFDINHLGENSHDKGLFGAGFYFGTHAPGWMFGSKNVMRVFLDIKKPFEILESVSGSRGAFYEYLVSKFDTPTLRSLQLTQYGNNINFGDYIDIIKSVNAEIAQGLHDEELANDEELQFYYPEDRMEVYRDRLISKRAGNFGTLANSMGYIIGEAIGSEEFSDAIKKAGYDGVIVDRGNNYKEYVAFEPNQIKSATENNGDFNPNNPDIRFSLVAPEGSSREQVLAAAAKAMPKTKVVDRYGRPRVVYHGTASEAPFNTFSYDEDFYFMTTSRGTAEQYTRKRGLLSVRPGQSGRIMPVFVNLENPYTVDANRRNWDNIPVGWKSTPATADEIARYAKENGYDGVIIKRVRDNMFNNDRSYADDIIAFDPIQIKSAGPKYELRKREHFPWDEYEALTSEVGDTFDDNGNKIPLGDRFDFDYNDDIRFSRSNDNQRIFISNAEASLGRVKMDKATPRQWLAMLEKEGGLKAGEDKWLGLSDWLRSSDKKTLTKQEVLDFIRKNEIVIEEVHYIENAPGFEELKAEYDKWLHDEGYDFAHEQLIDRFGDDAEIAFDDLGGELTVANEEAASSLLGSENLINLTRLDYTTSGLKNKHEIALTVPTIEPYNEHDTIHFGDAGEGRAVAWSRFGDAHDEDGRKVLFIDEIQSKRHQDGREHGYRDESIKEEEKRVGEAYNAALDAQRELTRELDEKYGGTKGWTKTVDISRNGFVNYRIVPDSEKLTADEYAAYIRNKEEIERTTNLIDELQKKYRESGFVPTAPFEKNWHELAMKRMLRLAAEEGYDAVAWTTGEQQASRYDLSHKIGNIYIAKSSAASDLYDVRTFTADEDILTDASGSMTVEQMREVFGKDLSARLIGEANKESGKQAVINGEGLRIGGEGMKGFYDEILPRFMNKYGKKWGVKVEDVNFPELGDEGITAHAVRVTPEMKESVMQGQLMFSKQKRQHSNDAKTLLAMMKDNAEERNPVELTQEMWDNEVSKTSIKTPIGDVKFGEHQLEKYIGKDRAEQFGMVIPTLERPDIIFEESSPKDGAERQTKYVFVKTFTDKAGEKKTNYASITVKQDGLEVSISSHHLRDEQVLNKIENEPILWNRFETDSTPLAQGVSMGQSEVRSGDKGSNNSGNNNTRYSRSGVNGAELLMFSRKFSAEEIAEMETPILESKGTFKNLSDAEDWAKLHLQGKSYTNKFTKASVYIGNKSISEMLDEESAKKIDIELHKAALMSVPEFITDGIPAEIHPDTHGRDFDVMRLYSAIKLNDDIYRVKSTVRRVKQGDRYYTYELQEMELTEERPQTGKGEEHSPHNPNSSVNSISGAKLLKGVKKTNSSETIFPENSNTLFSRSRLAVEKVSKGGIGALVGKDNVGDLLANIYEVLPLEVRRDIVANAERSGWNIHESVATYISELAARGFENDESGILRAVAAIMDYYAEDGGGYDDNTQRYLLWKIGQPSTDDILAFISDVAMRNRWNVGRTEQDGNIRFSLSDNLEGQKAAADAVVDDAKESFDTKKKALKGDLLTAAKAMATQKEYDKSTVEAVTRLAKTLLKEQGIDRMSRLEVGRLLGIVTTSVGKSPRIVKRNADALVDIIIDHLIRLEQSRLDNLANTKASRTNTTGVEVQGALDLQGQNTLKAFKAGLDMQIGKDVDETDGTTIIGRMNILSERMDSEDDTVSSEARAEYDGLALAKEYLENVSESRSEEVAIRNEMKDAAEKRRAGEMTAGQYSAFVVEAEHAIRENRIERIEALRELQLKMQGIVSGSRDAAAEFREREKQRIEEIHHLANSDMQGTSASAFEKPRFLGRLANTSLVRFFASSLASFDQFLRMLGRKNIRGEGYLWSKFMRGWEKATENAYLGQRDAKKELDDKVSEVFDKDGMRWSDLYEIERKMPTATVKWWDGGEMKEHELTQGQLLYIYMVNKMSDGRMKLRRMGIEEEHVQAIVRQMDDRFLQLADWMQGEFLVKLRNKYNAVHERLFGASMAAIDDYFPLKINKRSLNQQEDIGRPDLDDSLPATTTGSIIKRKRNSQDLDLPNADAFSVMIEHIDQMEQWAAFAEFNKDLNTLLSYKRFRNQVKNTTSIYGTGDQLWEKFKNICRIAGGTYRPKVKIVFITKFYKERLDAAAVNLAKGVTMAKISFRVYTALKQFLSMPAFVSDANIGFLVQDMVNPAAAWRWAMENLPLVEKRWKSRQAGDSRLLQTETDWKLWQNKVVEWSGRIGMTPNAFVDAVTVSIGAHAMYRTRYNEYIKDGYSEEEADRKAKEDATILYNETQQSNEGAFLSDIQLDRTVFSTMITVFRNSSMGYQRQLHDALRGLGRMMRKGYKTESIEFMSKQMVRDGLTEEQALHAANRQYNKAIVRNVVRVGTFGFLVQFAWNLGSSVVYLLFGDDDDKKKEMLTDAAIKAMLGGSVEGLAGGNVLSEMLSLMANGKGLGSYNPTLLPLISDMKSTYQKFSNDWVAGVNDLINLAVQAGFGFNPQTFEDAIVAVVDAAGGNMDISKEAMMFALRVIQVPQSQLDELLIDELNINGKKSDEMDYWDVAERYARYKLHRTAPVTGWLYSDEAEQNREDKYLKQFNKKVRAREELIYGEEED